MSLKNKRRVHFVGIGGIGMSGIARVMLEMGHEVTGSDLEPNDLTRRIEAMGGKVFEGHNKSNIPKDASLLVYSSSIAKNNPELIEASRRKIRVMHRAEMLGELFNEGKGIAVSGTHGKTTTTSLVSVMLKSSGLDPTVIIGGEVSQFEGNANLGKAGIVAAEADESDSSFLHLKPFYAVITNIEMEHLDHFKSIQEIKGAYGSFISNLKKGGKVFYNLDDLHSREVLKNFKKASASFGFSGMSDIYPAGIKMSGFSSSFSCMSKGRSLGMIRLNVPGRHNILNALAAISVGLEVGIPFKDIASSLESFTGAKRRFQLRSDAGGVMLIEDYAHHPTEIRVVLDACRNWTGKRIVAVFQPHRYSRTKFLAEEFGRCFNGVDKLLLTDIYAASEKPLKGVTTGNIYKRVKDNGIEDVEMIKKDKIADRIMDIKKPGDMILILGAGDIKAVANELAERMESSKKDVRGLFLRDKRMITRLKKEVRGKIAIGENLGLHTSFRIGGPAAIWVEPADIGDLKKVLSISKSQKSRFFIIGNGSNLLASDAGFDGIMIHLGAQAFKDIFFSGKTIRVGAGYSLPKLVMTCCRKGLAGMESLVGIPGTVGGAVFMNAGGSSNPIYKNIGELVTSLKVMGYDGKVRSLRGKDLRFDYRNSNLNGKVVLEATLRLEKGDSEELTSNCTRFLKMKWDKQVLDLPSAGCVFKNPENSLFTCGQMIEMLGLKGRRIGGAEISAKHANFIVNKGGATSGDVFGLIDMIKDDVKRNYGIDLELEVKTL